jgi:hypothetical protein
MSLTVREDGNIAGLEQMFTQSASETGETSAEASLAGRRRRQRLHWPRKIYIGGDRLLPLNS